MPFPTELASFRPQFITHHHDHSQHLHPTRCRRGGPGEEKGHHSTVCRAANIFSFWTCPPSPSVITRGLKVLPYSAKPGTGDLISSAGLSNGIHGVLSVAKTWDKGQDQDGMLWFPGSLTRTDYCDKDAGISYG